MDNTIIKILSSLFWEVFFYSLMGLQYVCLQHVISKHDLSNYWRAYKTKDVSRILVRDKTNHQPFSSTFDSLRVFSIFDSSRWQWKTENIENLILSFKFYWLKAFYEKTRIYRWFERRTQCLSSATQQGSLYNLTVRWSSWKNKNPRSSSQAFRRVLAFKGGSNAMLSIFSLWNQESQLPWRSREGKQFSMIS